MKPHSEEVTYSPPSHLVCLRVRLPFHTCPIATSQYPPRSLHGRLSAMLDFAEMIYVTTSVCKDHDLEYETTPPSWRVQSCTINFGSQREPLTFSSDWVYASPDAAHADMRAQALEKIRLSGYTGPEEEIVWRLHMIG